MPEETLGKENGQSPLSSPVTVLFCSHDFERGFLYTQEACKSLPGIQVTRCPRQDLESHISSAHILVPLMAALDAPLLHQASKAKLVLQFGVGLEGVDIAAATKLGIQVSNIPSAACGNALSCAEMAIYLLLCCLKHAHEMAESIRTRRLGLPIGDTLFGKTCLVVGYGNIAKELVPRLSAFKVSLIGVRQSPWGTGGDSELLPNEQLFERRGQWPQLLEMVATADLIVLTCTVTDATRGLVNAEFLRHCRPGVIIVNVARGGLLDYDAVLEGLDSGRIGALGLDVQWQEPFDPSDPIAKHPRVYLTPHVAGVTELSYRGMASCVAKEAQRLQQGLPATVRINQL